MSDGIHLQANFKRTRSYPIPGGAEIVTDRRGQRFAKWTDRKTVRTRKAPVVATPDGDRVAVESGNHLIAYFDAENDLEEQARRERSEFLQYENAAGEVADFHGATRHGYISATVAGVASVKTVQEPARHSTPVLTIGRYSHARLHGLTEALEALARLDAQNNRHGAPGDGGDR